MKPIFLGILFLIIGVLGWVVSIVLNVLTLGAFRWVSNAFAIIAIASMPVAVMWSVFARRKGK